MNMRTTTQPIHTHLVATLLFAGMIFPYALFAQSDGSAPPPDASTAIVASEGPTTSTGMVEPAAIPVPPETRPTQVVLVATTSPSATAPVPLPAPLPTSPISNPTPKPNGAVVVATASPAITDAPVSPVLTSSTALPDPSQQDENPGFPMLFIALLAVFPFGYLAAKLLRGKGRKSSDEDCSHCYELKKLLENKLKELTDLKERAKEFAEDAAREKALDALEGTKTGKALALLDRAEEEYERLKRLFEECMTDFERSAYHGVIIENSLVDTKLLDKMKVENTDRAGDVTIQHVLIGKKLAEGFAEHMHDGPWCAYFWKEESDEMKVVFKDRVFAVKPSDRGTWIEALAHGKALGIPDERLDFSLGQ